MLHGMRLLISKAFSPRPMVSFSLVLLIEAHQPQHWGKSHKRLPRFCGNVRTYLCFGILKRARRPLSVLGEASVRSWWKESFRYSHFAKNSRQKASWLVVLVLCHTKVCSDGCVMEGRRYVFVGNRQRERGYRNDSR